jgi:sulfonate transport system substrate-binding protein
MRGGAWLAAVLLLLVAIAPGVRAGEPLVLRIGWAVVPGQLTSLIFAKPELLAHYGKSYTVELVHFRGSAPQITALAAGDLDIAALAFSSFGLAIQNAHMDDLRAIGDLYQDGVDGYYANEYVGRTDSAIHSIEDLKGKALATNGIGGAIDMALRKILRDHGLQERRDYQIVEVQFPNMAAALDEHKVDLAGMVMPFALSAKKAGKIRTLFTMKDAMGETQTPLMATRQEFLSAHHDELVDFFSDWRVPCGGTTIRRIGQKPSRYSLPSRGSHPALSTTGSSPSTNAIATQTLFRISGLCRAISMFRRSWDCSRSRSTPENIPISPALRTRHVGAIDRSAPIPA